MVQVKFVKDSLENFEVISSAQANHITSFFESFTWVILEYFDPYETIYYNCTAISVQSIFMRKKSILRSFIFNFFS